MSARLLTDDAVVHSEALGEDEALLQLGDQKFVLDYEAVYDLAFRLVHLVNEMGDAIPKERRLQ